MMIFDKASLRINGLAYIEMYRQYKGGRGHFLNTEMSKSENTSEY